MFEKIRRVIRSLPIRLALRVILGVVLILVGIALLFLPGPGLVVIFAGLLVLGFTIDDIVDVCRKVIPGFDEKMAESILSHRFLRRFRRKIRASAKDPDAPRCDEDDHQDEDRDEDGEGHGDEHEDGRKGVDEGGDEAGDENEGGDERRGGG